MLNVKKAINLINMGCRYNDKFRILIIIIMRALRNILNKSAKLSTSRARILNYMSRDLCVKIDDTTYLLPDYEAFRVVEPGWEPYLKELFKLNNNENFLDVGSHIGKYTIQIAKKYSRSLIISVEPSPINFSYLVKNIRINRVNNVIPFNLAAYDSECILSFEVTESSTHHKVDERGGVKVKAKPLDDLLDEIGVNAHLIKIDVEGSELKVLKGLRRTLSRTPSPRIIVEVLEENLEKFLRYMNNLGYNSREVYHNREYGFYYFYCERR